MSSGLQTKKLSDVCQIRPPKKEAKELLSETDLVSFVPMNDLGIRQKALNHKDEKPLGKVVGSYTYFAENDVLLAKITPCFENGKLGIARGLKNGIGFGSSEYIVFRSKGEIDPEYLFYFLSQDSFRDTGAKVMTGAVGHKRVPKEFIEDHPIPLPSLDEQKRIVAIIDEAFAGIDTAIANTEKNLANARELFESYLDSVFSKKGEGWIEKRLGDVAEFKNGLNYSKDSKGKKLPVVGVGDFQNNYYVPIEKLELATIDGELHASYEIKKDDVLTVRSNGSKNLIGRCMLVPEVHEQTSFSGFVIRIRVDVAEVNPQFFLWFMKSRRTVEQLTRDGGGANINNINQKKLSTLSLCYPDSLSRQLEIIQSLSELSEESKKLEFIYQQKLISLNELKQSLLQKAFSGELTAEGDKLMDEAVA